MANKLEKLVLATAFLFSSAFNPINSKAMAQQYEPCGTNNPNYCSECRDENKRDFAKCGEIDYPNGSLYAAKRVFIHQYDTLSSPLPFGIDYDPYTAKAVYCANIGKEGAKLELFIIDASMEGNKLIINDLNKKRVTWDSVSNQISNLDPFWTKDRKIIFEVYDAKTGKKTTYQIDADGQSKNKITSEEYFKLLTESHRKTRFVAVPPGNISENIPKKETDMDRVKLAGKRLLAGGQQLPYIPLDGYILSNNRIQNSGVLRNGKMVFCCNVGDFTNESYEIFIMNTDGSDLRRLTFTEDVSEVYPEWISDKGICYSIFYPDAGSIKFYVNISGEQVGYLEYQLLGTDDHKVIEKIKGLIKSEPYCKEIVLSLCITSGQHAASKGEYNKAINYLRNALLFVPDSASAHYNLGYTLAQKGDTAAMEECNILRKLGKPNWADIIMKEIDKKRNNLQP